MNILYGLTYCTKPWKQWQSTRFGKGAPCVKGPLMNNLERFMSSLASQSGGGKELMNPTF